MSTPLRVLLVTDSFPPICGGSGWSTYELARGLTARGHHVEVIKADATGEAGVSDTRYEGLHVTTFRRPAPGIPVIRNIVKNERLWAELASYLRDRVDRDQPDILHAQHVMTTVPAIRAGVATGVPVVATVRDYWPVCYWSDLIYDPSARNLCPGCTAGNMTRCIRPRAGAAFPAAWGLIPYMRANLRTKRQELARAGAIVAVSNAIARDLRERAPELAASSIYTIPNPVDMHALDVVHDTHAPLLNEPYLLYAGKLATNKGVQYLVRAVKDAGIRWPVVVAGDGPLRETLEAEARRHNIDLRVLGWIDRPDVLSWMRHATVLAFPSYGPESLSRVLIEAAALGVPIAAMDTGGTRDILSPNVTGLVSSTPEAFARDSARLAGDERLRAGLGRAARADVRLRFAAESVVERVEQVYRRLLLPEAA